MTNQKLYQIGLTMINGIGDILGRQLLQTLGSAEAIFAEKQQSLEKVSRIGRALALEIKKPEVLHRAEKELAFLEKNQITACFFTDEHYPTRLRECTDAPLLLYFKGNANLNASRIISLVGTRQATDYGREQTDKLISDLSLLFPDLLLVSGLAYGIDIMAHRSALKHQLPTVGVLAHGLDRIYPPTHRATAVEMLLHGGLLTDFPSETTPDKPNFIKRNRIVAGLADAVIVVESADKGGSLITADIAFSYDRDVFAFPGKATDIHSQGCNKLIRQNKAGLITGAADLISAMRWDVSDQAHGVPQQIALPFLENEKGNRILQLIQAHNEMHVNQLAIELDMPIHQLSTLMFELEMSGLVKVMPGNSYRLTSI